MESTEIREQENLEESQQPAQGRIHGISAWHANITLLITLGLYLGYEIALNFLPWLQTHTAVRLSLGELIILLPAVVCMKIHRVDWKEFIRFRGTDGWNLKMSFCAWLCTMPVIIVLNMITMRFTKNVVSQVLPEVMSEGIIVTFLVMAVVPALVEEFVFRGLMYHAYRQYSVPAGMILSALIFGLMHMNFNQMAYAAFLGLVFAIMVEATGSIRCSMFMHFLTNGTSVAINYAMQYFYKGQMPELSPADTQQTIDQATSGARNLISMAIILAFMLFLLWRIVRKTLRRNHRSLRTQPSAYVKAQSEAHGFNVNRHIFDIWLLAYIAETVNVIVRNLR